MRITAHSTGQLTIREISLNPPAAVYRGVIREEHILPPEFLHPEKVSIEKTYVVERNFTATRRPGDPLPAIAIDVETIGSEAPLVVLRHPSGAITFHPSVVGPSLGTVHHFRIPLRRGQILKAAVLKVAKPVIDAGAFFALAKLARLWEASAWRKHGIAEGWHRVLPAGGGELRMEPGIPDSNDRNLLLIHGTFSDAASAYGALTQTDFFSQAGALYGNRIYAFNHFSVSRSPQENAKALLSALPDRLQVFDVVTHSRGGLVLRTLVERAADFGSLAARFQLGRAVLVASPNEGTPLATPDRWTQAIGWVANLLKIIEVIAPGNPFLTAADFVAEGIVWLAHHVSGDLPGLRSMDAGGDTIARLQAPPAPPPNAYSALVANFQPDQTLWQRMLDAGVDQFYGGANDLVVPSEGGWRVDRDGGRHVNPECVGCFGPGGNIARTETSGVTHGNFFHRAETAAFLVRALAGQPQNLPAFNLDAPLPDRRFIPGP